jgi:hypothetical protein
LPAPHGQDAQTHSAPCELAIVNVIPLSNPAPSIRSFNFSETYALVVILQAAELFLLEGLSEDAVNNFLKLEIEKSILSQPDTPNRQLVVQQIPKSVDTILICLGLSHNIIHATCCPCCFLLYSPPIWPTAYNRKKRKPLKRPSTTLCTSKFYSSGKHYVCLLNGVPTTCGTSLFKNPQANGNYPYNPVRTFSYHTLTNWISLPHFEDLLDSPLAKRNVSNIMTNV